MGCYFQRLAVCGGWFGSAELIRTSTAHCASPPSSLASPFSLCLHQISSRYLSSFSAVMFLFFSVLFLVASGSYFKKKKLLSQAAELFAVAKAASAETALKVQARL